MEKIKLRTIVSYISRIGIDEEVKNSDIRSIKLTNILALITPVIDSSLIPIIIFFMKQDSVLKNFLIFTVIINSLFLLSLLLNYKKKYILAAITFNSVGIIYSIFVTISFGKESMFYLILLIVIVSSIFIYPRRKKVIIKSIISICCLIFIILLITSNFFEPIILLDQKLLKIFNFITTIYVVIFISVFSIYSFSVLSNTEESAESEYERSESLLLNILPKNIAIRLKSGTSIISDSYADVTVLFADIVGFTELSASMKPEKIVGLLNALFSYFDSLISKYQVEKIKTIGDAYMVAAGVPVERIDHAETIACFALEMQDCIKQFNIETGLELQMRIGINSGSVVAGVIGKKKFIYDMWGDSVNTASRMESCGIDGEIQVSEVTYNKLKLEFYLEYRDEINIKGKGLMCVYILRGQKPKV